MNKPSARRTDFGARVRELRRARGLSQDRLGERAGLSFKFVGEIERGLGNPTLDSIAALARALDVQIATLFPESPPTVADETMVYPLPRADYERVREALDSLDGVFERLPRSLRRSGKLKRR